MKTFKGGFQALQEEWESFLASQWHSEDLSTCNLPKTSNTSPLDNSAGEKVMSYQEYWRIKPDIYLCPILNKKQHFPLDEVKGNLKEKWTFQIQIDGFSLFPGDSFGIYPPNSQETLQNLSQRFPFEHQPFHVLNHASFRADFASFPKKAHLKYLGDFCSQEKQREFLYFLSCSAGSSAYARLRDKFVGFEEIFQFFAFDGCSLEQLLRIVPLLQPRYYSLANCMRRNPSNSHNPNAASFLFSVEPFGLANNWLPGLPIGFEVAVVQKAVQLFRFPFSFAGPILLIATGTGMAPFASLIQELAAFQVASTGGESCSWPILLFFGCRTPKDIVFPWEIAQASPHSFVSYSRETPFKHVQDSLRENAAMLREIFQSQDFQATIWICGSVEMVKDVTKVLGEILSNFAVIQQEKRFRIEIF